MPSLRKKVAGFMRQLSISNLAGAVENIGQGEQQLHSPRNVQQDFSEGCFITRYLNGLEEKQEGPSILYGRNPEELPTRLLGKYQENEEIFSALTGPDGGLTTVNLQDKHLSIDDADIDYIDALEQDDQYGSGPTLPAPTVAGVTNWFNPHELSYGMATTLYEKNPISKVNNGDPIADCFAIAARPNSAILTLADGVNWGVKARTAARSAVHGSMEYLNKALFNTPTVTTLNTRDIFGALLRSFHAAHSLILQEQGMLTTLTACVILPLPIPSTNPCYRKYVACTCNVGDSLAYVYSRKSGVREITRGSHDINCMRDMRDALGALGPVDGTNPELNNLTLAITEVEPSDIVFLTSDGISDNFDPVVGKFAVLPTSSPVESEVSSSRTCTEEARSRTRRKSSENFRQTNSTQSNGNGNNLPVVEAHQRHELTLLRMEDLLRRGVSGEGPPCNSAKHLCELLLDFSVRITAAKRRILEDTDLYYAQHKDGQLVQLSKQEQRSRRKKTIEKISMIPGKLDHATVVAYVVGSYDSLGYDA